MPESNESNDAPDSSDPFNTYHRQIDGKWVGPREYRWQWRDVKTLINKNSQFLGTGIIFIMLSEKLTVFDPLK